MLLDLVVTEFLTLERAAIWESITDKLVSAVPLLASSSLVVPNAEPPLHPAGELPDVTLSASAPQPDEGSLVINAVDLVKSESAQRRELVA